MNISNIGTFITPESYVDQMKNYVQRSLKDIDTYERLAKTTPDAGERLLAHFNAAGKGRESYLHATFAARHESREAGVKSMLKTLVTGAALTLCAGGAALATAAFPPLTGLIALAVAMSVTGGAATASFFRRQGRVSRDIRIAHKDADLEALEQRAQSNDKQCEQMISSRDLLPALAASAHSKEITRLFPKLREAFTDVGIRALRREHEIANGIVARPEDTGRHGPPSFSVEVEDNMRTAADTASPITQRSPRGEPSQPKEQKPKQRPQQKTRRRGKRR